MVKKENLYSKDNNIFQSKIWAEFQKMVGREAIEIEGNFFYKEHLIRDKHFLYCPKSINDKQLTVNSIKKVIVDKSVVFARVEPMDSLGSHPKENDPFWKPVTHTSILSQQHSPKQTLILDLTKSEDEILTNMKSKHRYNIRLAEKKGVKVRQGTTQKDIDDFYNLSLEVASRDKSYSPHPKSYYEKMVQTIGKGGQLQIFTAEYEGKALSSLIIIFYNDTAIYLHGASSNQSREVMPNHLSQWQAIKEAKNRGCKLYDFWGTSLIQNQKNKKQNDEVEWIIDEGHAWSGVSKFKLGFVKVGETGEVVDFTSVYDLPTNKVWYNGLSLINYIRKAVKK